MKINVAVVMPPDTLAEGRVARIVMSPFTTATSVGMRLMVTFTRCTVKNSAKSA